MKVRVGKRYVYKPAGVFDLFRPCTNLKSGDEVKVINLYGCPRANTMGQCYVGDPKTGKFIGMVSTSSLQEKIK